LRGRELWTEQGAGLQRGAVAAAQAGRGRQRQDRAFACTRSRSMAAATRAPPGYRP
jgi:hypothetical protein